jgi:hypothetical protein
MPWAYLWLPLRGGQDPVPEESYRNRKQLGNYVRNVIKQRLPEFFFAVLFIRIRCADYLDEAFCGMAHPHDVLEVFLEHDHGPGAFSAGHRPRRFSGVIVLNGLRRHSIERTEPEVPPIARLPLHALHGMALCR